MIDDFSGCIAVSDVRFRPIMSQSNKKLKAQRKFEIFILYSILFKATLWLRGFEMSGWCLHGDQVYR